MFSGASVLQAKSVLIIGIANHCYQMEMVKEWADPAFAPSPHSHKFKGKNQIIGKAFYLNLTVF